MGFLDELIKTIQEAVDEANGRPPRPVVDSRPDPGPARPAESATRERQRHRHDDARQAEREKAERARADSRQRQVADAAASTPGMVTTHAQPPQTASSACRLRRLLGRRETVREAVLLSEVLGRPLSQRQRR